MSTTGFVKIECVQGDPIDRSFTFDGVTLTGYTGEAPIRDVNYTSVGAFTVTVPTSSSVRLQLSGTLTAAMAPERYLSQLRLTPPGGGSKTYLNVDLIIHRKI